MTRASARQRADARLARSQRAVHGQRLSRYAMQRRRESAAPDLAATLARIDAGFSNDETTRAQAALAIPPDARQGVLRL